MRRMPRAGGGGPAGSADVEFFLAHVAVDHGSAGGGWDAGVEAVERICRALDGLPLAIELAAERARTLPLALVEQQVTDSQTVLGFLRRQVADVAGPSISNVLARRWAPLGPDARRTLASLCVLTDSFTLEAAATVSGDEVSKVVDEISELLDLQLVDQDPSVEGLLLFRLPRLVRAHGLTILGGTRVDEAVLRERHTRYLAGLAAVASRAAYDGRPALPLAGELEAAIGDVDAALAWAERHALDLALRLATDLAVALPHRMDRLGLDRRLPALVDTAVGDVPATALVEAARATFRAAEPGGVSRAVRSLEAALERLRLDAEPRKLLWGLTGWIDAFHVTGDLERAARCVAEGLAVAGELDDQPWPSRYEAWHGMVLHQSGDVPAAIAWGERALTRARRHKDPRGQLLAGMLLFPMDPRQVNVPGGAPTLDELLELAEALGEERIRLITMAALAGAALARGDEATAARWLHRRTTEVAHFDRWSDLGLSLVVAVELAVSRGDDELAARWHGAISPSLSVRLANLPPVAAATYSAILTELTGRLAPDPLARAVRAGALDTWPELARQVTTYAAGVLALHQPTAPRDPVGELTSREREVLAMIAGGATNKEAAERLCISAKTVMHHSVSIYRKLGVSGRVQAAAWALRHGVV